LCLLFVFKIWLKFQWLNLLFFRHALC
jgi:hypothetical protein